MLKRLVKQLTEQNFFTGLGLLLIKVISATYRYRVVHPEIEQRILQAGQVPIYASWHQRFFAGINFFSTRRPLTVMISQSRDGEMIARIALALGHFPARGSSSRGGRQALQEIYRQVEKGSKIGHIVDGPRGPLGSVKPGLLLIAQLTGMPIVPTIISAEKKWTFNSWDRFMVPKPFSRVIIRFGDAIHVPRHLAGPDFEDCRSSIEKIFKDLYAETDRMWPRPLQP